MSYWWVGVGGGGTKYDSKFHVGMQKMPLLYYTFQGASRYNMTNATTNGCLELSPKQKQSKVHQTDKGKLPRYNKFETVGKVCGISAKKTTSWG